MRFFLDRTGHSYATEPRDLDSITGPGTLAAISDAGDSIVTVDDRNFVVPVETCLPWTATPPRPSCGT